MRMETDFVHGFTSYVDVVRIRVLYRLVQVKKPKFSPPLIPLAISSQRVNIWCHGDPHDRWKRVTWAFIFKPASGCLQERNSYLPMRGLQFFNNIRLFPSGGEKTKLRRILHDPVGRTPRHVCRIFRAKKSMICPA